MSERSLFLRRTLFSLGLLIALLSLGLNAFFVATRKGPPPPSPEVMASSQLAPHAFGDVRRGFVITPQRMSGTQALLPVSSYTVPSAVLYDLPPTLALYRDQGIALPEGTAADILKKIGAPAGLSGDKLSPAVQRWRTSDGAQVVVDIDHLMLTLTRPGMEVVGSGSLTDNEVKIGARSMLSSFGIDPTPYGDPHVFDAGGKAYAAWPLSLSGIPVVDTAGRSVAALSVDMKRSDRSVGSAVFTLVDAERLSHSDYPTAPRPAIVAGLQSGGLLPIATGLKGKAAAVAYSKLETAYMLLPDRPIYVVPVVWATWMQAPCASCAPIKLGTFVPALDPSSFEWVNPGRD